MKVVILAGGAGTRLWPYSRKSFPKQFLKLIGDASFLQETIKRALRLVSIKDLSIVIHDAYLHVVRKQVEEIDSSLVDQLILEPSAKNTTPALALALRTLILQGASLEEKILVLPADHLISPVDKFVDQMKAALPLADEGIITFGLTPSRPETGYGYLRKEPQGVKFIEKPTLEKAKELLLEGNSFWNSGMFLFTMRPFLSEVKEHAHSFYEYILGEKDFEELESISIDYAIMEKSSSLKLMPLALTWSDVGSWESIYDLSEKDENQNVVRGNVHSMNTERCLIYAESRLVTTLGLQDLFIIETADALLVMHKQEAQRVKGLVEHLKRGNFPESDEHRRVYRPWGHYTILEEGARYKIKQIVVEPHQSLSLQMHYHRSEHWVVVTGTAKVSIGEREEIVHEQESIFVPKSSIHRLTNPGKVALKIIEVQVGEYLGEDDIVRWSDDYGRIKKII